MKRAMTFCRVEYAAILAALAYVLLAILLVGAAQNPITSITPPKTTTAQSPKATSGAPNAVMAVTVAGTNYANFSVSNLPVDYGGPSTATHFLFINWSEDNGKTWHEGGLLLTNGFTRWPTNKYRIYRLVGAPLGH